ncbi:uncharacterized protein BYT42DRAFT_609613 [Radiomyces spectabilis]|uniref:uncharacterized protein n=1 Tax=Radiomyces spectabilis TaxID=64574 RepID=UPI00221F1546|nr:uncharacterized protein BYT42DRAFT_609613 [Radiomyces spectabilis]KAI8393848.1 hypothetical protein BYT42DRAFT_609613 [Radiomyces spectabilis]
MKWNMNDKAVDQEVLQISIGEVGIIDEDATDSDYEYENDEDGDVVRLTSQKIMTIPQKCKRSKKSTWSDGDYICEKAEFYKAMDWIRYMRHTVQTLALRYAEGGDTMLAVMYLTKLWFACFTTTDAEIKQVSELLMLWVRNLVKFNRKCLSALATARMNTNSVDRSAQRMLEI